MSKALALALSLAMVVPVWAPVAAYAAEPTAIPLVTAEAAQHDPDISGRYVVWEDERWGYDDLWVYDLATGKTSAVSGAPGKQALPAIDGTSIVAEDYRNNTNSNLYRFDLSGFEQPISLTGLVNRYSPDISGDWVAWMDQRNGNNDIYAYNTATDTEKAIVTDGFGQSDPAVSGKWVVWTDTRRSAGAWGDIYAYKLTTGTEQPVCINSSIQGNPAVSGERVVWQDYRNDTYDIYAYDFTKAAESAVCTNPATQSNPAISGRWVVWQDSRNGNYDIYGYDFDTGTEFPVCTAAGDQTLPSVSGDWVVWQDARGGGTTDIYGASLTPLADLAAGSIVAGSSAFVGASVPVTVTVGNQGSAAASASVAGVYLSTDAVIDDTDIFAGTLGVGPVSAGASTTVAGVVSLPHDLAPGTYRWGVIADSAGALTESNEANNAVAGGTLVVSAPANDSFSAATLLGGTSGVRATDLTYGASKQYGEPKHAGAVGGSSVWYRFVAPSAGKTTIDLGGSGFDTVLGVYRGSAVESLTLVAANDDAGARLASKVTFTAVKGATYYVAVDGCQGASGRVRIAWTHNAELSVPAAPAIVTRARLFTVTGTLKPRHTAGTTAVKLKCYRLEGSSWVLRKTVSAKVANYSSYSRYSVRTSLPTAGKWRVFAYHADADHAATTSGARSITVR